MAKKNVLTAGKKVKADQAARAGDRLQARELYAAVCKLDPLDVEAWGKLALIEKNLGNFQDAERCARRALALSPQLAFAHYALGQALHGQGQRAAACASYRTAIGLMPDFADAHYLLGLALHEEGAMSESVASLRQALRLRPDFAEALAELGAIGIDLGDIDGGLDFLRRAAALRPGDAAVQGNIGHALRLQGKNQAALEQFRHALKLAPENPDLIAGLAGLLEKMGSTGEAESLAAKGLRLAPGHPVCNLVAAQLDRRAERLHEAAERLQSLLGTTLPAGTEARIMLELGQLLDQMGDFERAYPLIVEGKRRKAQATLGGEADGRKEAYLTRVARARQLATPALASLLREQTSQQAARQFSERPPSGNAEGAGVAGGVAGSPVFLIGFPRSGTTLLEQILDSHPAIRAMEEKPAVATMVSRALAMLDEQQCTLADLNEGQVAELRERYFAEVVRHIDLPSGLMLVDKMPLNTIEAPVIARVFPDARFILAIRHPCDVCLSCLMQDFATNAGMANFFSLEDAAHLYAQVMDGWRHYAESLPLNHHRIRYEDLVADVPGETRKLLDFLGLPWDDAVLSHSEHARRRGAINTPSYHQVVQPVYQRARYRWRRYEARMAGVLPLLQPFIERFGYAEEAAPSSRNGS